MLDIAEGGYDDGFGVYPYSSEPRNLTGVGDVLFFTANDQISGRELWRSDGTAVGTFLVQDIGPGVDEGLSNTDLIDINGRLFFSANNSIDGNELWTSDGTDAGTNLVSDIFAGSQSSSPTNFTLIDNRLFFSAESADEGIELWESDGTDAGTTLVADIASGFEDSTPRNLFAFEDQLLFSADDGSEGFQFWTVEAVTAGTVNLAIYVDGESVDIPAFIGRDGDAFVSQITTDENGQLTFAPIADEPLESIRLDDFFVTWRTNAGDAGNNPDAFFSASQLLDNEIDLDNAIQMFVNGSPTQAFEDYVLQDGDDIAITFDVNPIVALNTTYGSMFFELFEDDTPGTVDNFLNYVNDGRFANAIFHRSVPGFVIQGGGFRTTDTTFVDTSQLSRIDTDPAIQNEFDILNTRGTISMAKLGSDPNSATNQFFVNLSDNTTLDTQNGGFTVFAQVLDMTVADSIAALSTRAEVSPYGELPVGDDDLLAVIEAVEGVGWISGERFADTNSNGVRDAGEVGISPFEVYIDSNDNGAFDSGEPSTLPDDDGRYRIQATAGTHTVRIIPVEDTAILPPAEGSYSVDVEVGRETTDIDFGEGQTVRPASISLALESDTGINNQDNLTSFNNGSSDATLNFEVTGIVVGAEVRVFADGELLGAVVAASEVASVTTDATRLLSEGLHNITATQIVGSVESAASDVLQITVDTTPPAGISNTLTDFPQSGVPYTFDVNSPGEADGSVQYELSDAPTGATIDSDTGVFSWTPDQDQARPHSFLIEVVDAAGNRNSTESTLNVLGAIAAFPDEFSVDEDTQLVVNTEDGVLSNDTADGTLVGSLVDNPTNGSLNFNPDGSFDFTPNPDFNGTDSFTYQASDGTDQSNVASATIVVNAVDDLVTGVADSYALEEDAVLNVDVDAGLLANDIDPDGDDLTTSIVAGPTNGTIDLKPDGSFIYTPNSEFSGTDAFTYQVNDGTNTTDPISVSIDITEVNDVPTGLVDSFTTNEDTILTVSAADGVLANDTDPDSANLSAVVSRQPQNGSLAFNADGSFTYTPDSDFFGEETFGYTVSDGSATSEEVTVTISVTSEADPPTSDDDNFDAPNDGTLQSLDVLANDSSEPDGDQTLTITSTSASSNGATIAINGNAIDYTAPIGFVGTDSFDYTIQDSDGLTATSTVTVNVLDAGSSVFSGYVYLDSNSNTTFDGREAGIPGVLITLSGTDVFGDPVTRTRITNDAGFYEFDELSSGNYQVTQSQPNALVDGNESSPGVLLTTDDDRFTDIELGSNELMVDNNFGEARLQPEYYSIAWFFASSGSQFREIVAIGEDNAGNAELAAAIREGKTDFTDDGDGNEVNLAPNAVDDTYTVEAENELSVTVGNGVLANDTDPEGDLITATVDQETSNGEVALQSNGSFVYTPDSGFVGTDTFTYTATDVFGNIDSATVTIDVEDVPNTFRVVENSPEGTAVGTVAEATGSAELTFEFEDANTENSFLNLRVDDHSVGGDAARAVLVEYLDFQCPVCRRYHPIVNALEEEFGDQLLVVRRHLPLESIHPNAPEAGTAAEAAGRQDRFEDYGDILFDQQDVWQVIDDPAQLQALFEGYADQLNLDLDQFRSDIADPAIQDRIDRDFDDIADNGFPLATPTFALNGEVLSSLPSADDPDEFEVLIQEAINDYDGTFDLDRRSGAITIADSADLDGQTNTVLNFNVVATAQDLSTNTIPITINLVGANAESPTAAADNYTIDEDNTLTTLVSNGVLSNDTDPDTGSVLTAQLATSTQNGTLTLDSDGSFTFVPNLDFSGTDSFTYRASDGTNTSNLATVTITVIGVNDAPVAANDSYSVNQTGSLVVDLSNGLLQNDTDPEDDVLTVRVTDTTSNGNLLLNPDGTFSYTPTSDFSGSDTFLYIANDGNLDSNEVTVSITVLPFDNPPNSNPDSYTTLANQTLDVNVSEGVLENDNDAEDDPLTARLEDGPTNGTVTLNVDGSFQYTPGVDFVGTDTFTYVANDGNSDSTPDTVTIEVEAANAIPVAGEDVYSVEQGTTLIIDAANGVLVNDTDGDGDALTSSIDVPPTKGTLTLQSDGSFTYVPGSGYFWRRYLYLHF